MVRKQLIVWCGAVAVVLILGHAAVAGQAGLVGHWRFDEGQGTTAFDSSGNGLDGTLRGNPTWVAGVVGGALSFNGSSDYVEVPNNPLLALTTQITIAAWTYMNTNASGEMAIVSKGGWAANNLPYELTEDASGVIFWQFYDNEGRDSCSPDSPPVAEWHHIAATYDGQVFKCYVDGVLGEEWAYAGKMPVNTAALTIGRRSTGGTFYNGMLDDVQLWERALADTEVQKIMKGLDDPSLAQDPSPEDLATDVPCDVVLSWTAGEYAATHDVYLGTVSEDVNNAGRDDAGDLLVSQDQEAAEYDADAPLDYGQTYFWRIDEVNAAPDNTIFKGSVWTFTTEPYGYPITGVTAEAANEQPPSPASRTIDGSGLD
ncbi:MAG: LamG domain-containing protein, partial [Phycisphaerales bacterium]